MFEEQDSWRHSTFHIKHSRAWASLPLAPPTFDVVVEIIDRDHILVHEDVAATVDALLRGDAVAPEERWRDEAGVHRTHQRIRPGALPGVEQRRFGGLTPGDARRGDFDARDENRGGWRKHRERSRRASAFGDLRNPA
ncbi:MAG: hypothetical protein ACKN9G_02405, partial [Candidatus Limnocylindrus sp.]